MKPMELGSAMVRKSPCLTPFARSPRAMRFVRLWSSLQVMLSSRHLTAHSSGLFAACAFKVAPMEGGLGLAPAAAAASSASRMEFLATRLSHKFFLIVGRNFRAAQMKDGPASNDLGPA